MTSSAATTIASANFESRRPAAAFTSLVGRDDLSVRTERTVWLARR
jgi:hypothetical protein